MINLNYLTDCLLYQIFKIILSETEKKHGEKADNLSMRIFVNKIENRIIYRIKTRYTAQNMKFSIKDFFSKCD